VLIGIAGMGLLSSLLMEGLPLSSQTDEKWNIQIKEVKEKEIIIIHEASDEV
jgi:hypothetical protein